MSAGFRDAAGEVPPAPRPMTEEALRDSELVGRFQRVFGALWFSIGLGVGVFLVVIALLSGVDGLLWGAGLTSGFAFFGAVVWLAGHVVRARAVRLFQEGKEAHALVTSVEQDLNIRLNNRHPWVVRYRSDDGKIEGEQSFYDLERPEAEPGQRVIVLYDPAAPGRSVLWTRVSGRNKRPAPAASAAPPRVRVADEPAAEADDADAAEEASAEDDAERARKAST